jgi:NADH-quinone oxidoreductase subunit J
MFSGIAVFALTITILVLFFKNEFQNSDKNILNEVTVISDDNTKNLGYVLYTEYIFAFEIAAIILLLGIISAITLTQNKNKENKYQDPQDQIFVKKEDRLSILKDEDMK